MNALNRAVSSDRRPIGLVWCHGVLSQTYRIVTEKLIVCNT